MMGRRTKTGVSQTILNECCETESARPVGLRAGRESVVLRLTGRERAWEEEEEVRVDDCREEEVVGMAVDVSARGVHELVGSTQTYEDVGST